VARGPTASPTVAYGRTALVSVVDPDRYHGFPDGFFARMDEAPDQRFYDIPRLVTHIDEGAIAEVSRLYGELGLSDGEVLDLMSSWVSHQPTQPRRLVALGMNRLELEQNEHAHELVVRDLNADPSLPFEDGSFDAVTCCVSVDYLTRPLEVFDEVARVLRPGSPFICTFSNRCFPTKAIRGWLSVDDATHCAVVAEYFRRSLTPNSSGAVEPGFDQPVAQHRNPGVAGDPLFAVWARRRLPPQSEATAQSDGDAG
jgi:SAM-dependent methyltransferase